MKVLLIEDSRTQALALGATLQQQKVNVEISTTGEQGLKKLDEGLRPDAVLCDVVMPGIDGYEVCRRIKAQFDIPVLIMTNPTEPRTTLRAIAAGADDFIAKPIRTDTLCRRLVRCCPQVFAALAPDEPAVELLNVKGLSPQGERILLSALEDAALRVEEVERHRIELAEANKRQEELMRVVAHEVRSPLNTLLLAAELADSGNEQRLAALPQRTLKECHRINRLLKDLSDVSSIDIGAMKLSRSTVPVDNLVRDAAVQAFDGSGRTLRFELSADAMADVDPYRMEQVVINLASNALKYAPEGDIIVHTSATEKSVRIEVRDEGPGIDEETQRRIFERYARGPGSERQEGAGIGLYLCRSIVEAHGGSIGVDSEPGQGATFWITLDRLS